MIKYVAMWGLGYCSYNLVQMRIDDINVVADLNEHDPNAPSVPPPTQDPSPQESQDYDGTASPTLSESSHVSLDLSSAMAQVICYWTGPWPLLHVVINQPVPHASGQLVASVHTVKNLLGVTEYSACSVTGDAANPSPDFDVGLWAWLIDEVFSLPLIATLQLSCGYAESIIRSGAEINPVLAVSAGVIMASAAMTAYFAPVLYALYLVDNGQWSKADAFWFLWSCGWNYVAVGFALIAGTVISSLVTKLTGVNVGAIRDFLMTTLARFDPVAKILQFSWLANIVITAIGLAIWATAVLNYAYW